MGRFKKKPVEIEARQITSDTDTTEEIAEWCGGVVAFGEDALPGIIIETIEGPMKASVGWWVIKGVENEFYPCKDSIFKESYEQVDW